MWIKLRRDVDYLWWCRMKGCTRCLRRATPGPHGCKHQTTATKPAPILSHLESALKVDDEGVPAYPGQHGPLVNDVLNLGV